MCANADNTNCFQSISISRIHEPFWYSDRNCVSVFEDNTKYIIDNTVEISSSVKLSIRLTMDMSISFWHSQNYGSLENIYDRRYRTSKMPILPIA